MSARSFAIRPRTAPWPTGVWTSVTATSPIRMRSLDSDGRLVSRGQPVIIGCGRVGRYFLASPTLKSGWPMDGMRGFSSNTRVKIFQIRVGSSGLRPERSKYTVVKIYERILPPSNPANTSSFCRGPPGRMARLTGLLSMAIVPPAT